MASLQYKKNLLAQVNLDRQISLYSAESGGFEPSIRLRVYRISSAALSTTQTTFLFQRAKVLQKMHIRKQSELFFEK